MNAAWHRANPMPPRATPDQRIRWHIAHAKECGCRPIPAKLADLIRKKHSRRPD